MPDCVKGRKELLTLIAVLYSNTAAMIHCLLLHLIITPDLVQHLNHISLRRAFISSQFTHFPARAVPFTPEAQVNPTATNLQPLYLEFWQPFGKRGVDVEAFVRRVGTYTEYRLQHLNNTAGRPGLPAI